MVSFPKRAPSELITDASHYGWAGIKGTSLLEKSAGQPGGCWLVNSLSSENFLARS